MIKEYIKTEENGEQIKSHYLEGEIPNNKSLDQLKDFKPKMERTKIYTIDKDELIKISCPKCKGKQGIRRKSSLLVNCYVCNSLIGEFKF